MLWTIPLMRCKGNFGRKMSELHYLRGSHIAPHYIVPVKSVPEKLKRNDTWLLHVASHNVDLNQLHFQQFSPALTGVNLRARVRFADQRALCKTPAR
jgi:hypothetical protein